MESLDPTILAALLLIAGLGCVALEVLLPSGGALGLVSVSLLVASVFVAFRYDGIPSGVTYLVMIAVLAPVMFGLAIRYLPHTPFGKVLIGEAPREEDLLVEDPRRILLGRIGVTRSKMLPSGAVEIDGMVIDAVTRGMAIDPGQYVKVIEVRGNRVVVSLAASHERPAQRSEQSDDLLARSLEELGIEAIDDPLS